MWGNARDAEIFSDEGTEDTEISGDVRDTRIAGIQRIYNEMNKQNEKQLKQNDEIKIKENPKLEKLRKAPEEVVAMAIRDMIRKDGGGGWGRVIPTQIVYIRY